MILRRITEHIRRQNWFTGDLRLIGDPEIQRGLTQWPRTAQVLIEWQEIERHHGEELIGLLEARLYSLEST